MSDTLPKDNYLTFLNFISEQISYGVKSQERTARKNALNNIFKKLDKNKKITPQPLYEQIFLTYHKELLVCLNDPVEKCRELAAAILNILLNKLCSIDDLAMANVIGCLLLRLSTVNEREPSEEVRGIEMDLLCSLVRIAGKKLLKNINDIIHILERCIVDESPEIKRKACVCTSDVACSLQGNSHASYELLICPLLKTVTHPHSKIRFDCIMAIGSVVHYGSDKHLEEVYRHLTQRLYDPVPAVRDAVVHVVATWLLELPNRYSYIHHLLPLILSSLSDEVLQVRSKAQKYWEEIGAKYLEENENDYKKQIDFPKPVPEDYPGCQPTLGCRVLVRRYFTNFLPALLHDLQDWVVETRVKAIDLLCCLLLHVEENASIKVDSFFDGIMIASKDTEKRTSELAIKAAEYLGYFVPVELWCSRIIPAVLEKAHCQSVAIFAALIRGSINKEFQEHYLDMSRTLADPILCHNEKPEIQANLLLGIEAILLTKNHLCSQSSYNIFCSLVSITSMTRSVAIAEKVKDILELLHLRNNLPSVSSLYEKYGLQFLQSVVENHEAWTSCSPEVPIFSHLLKNGSGTTDVYKVAKPIIINNLKQHKSPKLRSQMLSVISDAWKLSDSEQQTVPQDILDLLVSGILPNLSWSSGKTEAALRTISATQLYRIIRSKKVNNEMLAPISETIVSGLINLIDDDLPENRLLACKIFASALPKLILDEHCIHKTFQEILKCLDDERDCVRIAAISAFHAYFQVFSENYDWSPYKPYMKHIYQNILIHIDDEKKEIREKVYELLKDTSFAAPDILLNEIAVIKHAMSANASELCDKLIQNIHCIHQE